MALCVAVFTIIIIIVQMKTNRRIHNNSASAIAETPMYEDVEHQLSKDSVTDMANKNISKSKSSVSLAATKCIESHECICEQIKLS